MGDKGVGGLVYWSAWPLVLQRTTILCSILLRVRGVRDKCVTIFTFGAYVEKTGMFLPGDISYGPRPMPHNSLRVTLSIYTLITLFLYTLPCFCITSARP